MAQVEIVGESEQAACWVFDVQVLDGAGGLSQHRVRLSWADYNLWSADGGDAPARVAEAVVQFLLTRMTPDELGESFDASIARRKHEDADAMIPQFIRA